MISEIYEVIIIYFHNRVNLDMCPYYDGGAENEIGLFGQFLKPMNACPVVRFCVDRVASAALSKCRPI